jgi:CubicO group peptidase (beta-lactamase class C family)
MKSGGVAGAQVLVIRDGRTLLDTGFGLGAVASDEPADPRTRFEIGSITKQFTAAAILQLVEQHKLSLDDTLGKFLSDYPNAAGVTLRQLLWQVSGIPNYTAVPGFAGYSTSHAGGIEGILGNQVDVQQLQLRAVGTGGGGGVGDAVGAVHPRAHL